MQEATYYQVLELDQTASPLEIKKAYRRLALQYHPDRNLHETNSVSAAEAEERFKAVSHAYQVLSDPAQRIRYDASLKTRRHAFSSSSQANASSSNGTSSTTPRPPSSSYYYSNKNLHQQTQQQRHEPFPFTDPFVQFETLFRNDAFFQEAFADMEQEFAQRFSSSSSSQQQGQKNQRHQEQEHTMQPPGYQQRQSQRQRSSHEGGSWLLWLLRQCGISFQMTTYSTNHNGHVTATSYSSHHARTGAANKRTNRSSSSSPFHQSSSSSYTSKQTQSYWDPRLQKRVTLQSMERNGNWIEDRLENGVLVQRHVNGAAVAVDADTRNLYQPGK